MGGKPYFLDPRNRSGWSANPQKLCVNIRAGSHPHGESHEEVEATAAEWVWAVTQTESRSFPWYWWHRILCLCLCFRSSQEMRTRRNMFKRVTSGDRHIWDGIPHVMTNLSSDAWTAWMMSQTSCFPVLVPGIDIISERRRSKLTDD